MQSAKVIILIQNLSNWNVVSDKVPNTSTALVALTNKIRINQPMPRLLIIKIIFNNND